MVANIIVFMYIFSLIRRELFFPVIQSINQTSFKRSKLNDRKGENMENIVEVKINLKQDNVMSTAGSHEMFS